MSHSRNAICTHFCSKTDPEPLLSEIPLKDRFSVALPLIGALLSPLMVASGNTPASAPTVYSRLLPVPAFCLFDQSRGPLPLATESISTGADVGRGSGMSASLTARPGYELSLG